MRAYLAFIAILLIGFGGTLAEAQKVSWQTRLSKRLRRSNFLQRTVSQGLVQGRCRAYVSTLKDLLPRDKTKLKKECDLAAQLLLKSLNPLNVTFLHPLSGVEMRLPVAFSDTLLGAMENVRVLMFLQQFESNLQMSVRGISSASLYETALNTIGDSQETIALMSALFQDTSEARVQIQWLSQQRSRLSPLGLQTLSMLNEVIGRLIQIEDEAYFHQSPILRFPDFMEALGPNLTDRVYHFYVPAGAALSLKERGISPMVGVLTVWLFHYIYEIVEQGNPFLRVFTDPQKLDLSAEQDSYAAYRAALWSYGLKGEPVSFEGYQKLFGEDAHSGVVQFVWGLQELTSR
jgi:hypothetical protein